MLNAWQKRIGRAETLAVQHKSAAEVLGFFGLIVRLQEDLYYRLQASDIPLAELGFRQPISPAFVLQFSSLLAVVMQNGPKSLAETARQVRESNDEAHSSLLSTFWAGKGTDTGQNAAEDFLARAFLQPYAELVRAHTGAKQLRHTPCLCPFCDGKPGVGVLRPLGDGGQRFLVCSLCHAEWEFRRILCPACGEENHARLPVYCAEDFAHIRVECCDTCKTYIKTVDLTKNGLAEPIVDEIASIPLDIWAQTQGYLKLQPNLMQF